MSGWPVKALGLGIMLLALVAADAAKATGSSPLIPFLSKHGDIRGFKPGKAQVFRTLTALRTAGKERPSKREIQRFSSEGFVEAALVRMRDRNDPLAKGTSSVIEFEDPNGAAAEMKAELKVEFDRKVLARKGILDYFTLKHFGVPGVPQAAGVALVSNQEAARVGVESGVAKGLFVEGNCLIAVALYRQSGKEVTEPVISGLRASFSRTTGVCP